jgi:hypothetical protein
MTTLSLENKNIHKFINKQINLNYEKFKEENPITPQFYFLLVAVKIEQVRNKSQKTKNIKYHTSF